MAIQQYQMGTMRTNDYFQYFNQINRFFGDLIFSIIYGTILSLVFESPIVALEKVFLNNPEKTVKGETNQGYEPESGSEDVKEIIFTSSETQTLKK